MLRKLNACQERGCHGRIGAVGALVGVSILIAGCSADLGRFDLSGSGAASAPRSTAALPMPSEPLRRNAGIPVETESAYGDGGAARPAPYGGVAPPPMAAREAPVRMSGLPEPVSREPVAKSLAPARPTAPAAGRQSPAVVVAAPAAPPAAALAAGQVIEVQQGDTLYAISKRHRVSIAELMAQNNLQSPSIRPGQKIALPGGKRPVAQRPMVPATAVAPAAAPATVAQRPASPPPADWGGSYTVAQGDSLFAIARKHNVKSAELQAANAITDPTKVRPGTVLKVPGAGGPSAVAAAPPAAPVRTAPAPAAQPLATATSPVTGPQPRIINAGAPADGTKVAALGGAVPTATDVTAAAPKAEPAAISDPPKLGSSGKFRWPAKGKVIASFGPRADSTHNDGINISVPQGTDVVAAENGVVAYAGSELKGYGNLILVRHEGNWVSAYAHNETLLVKRGDKIKRGQAIAKAGNTGTVDQPQVHFELRQGSKPVDPIPHMEKN